MYYYNQLNYPGVSYDNPNTSKKETIDSSGCGVCSAAMVINNLAGKELYTVATMAKFSLSNNARDNSGTNMVTLLNALCKANKGFSYKATGSEDELIKHLNNGGMAIANQGDDYNVFSTAGHFIVAIKMAGSNIEVYDPQMYYGKYDKSPRPQRIVKKTERGCIVSKSEIAKATRDRYDYAYYLVTYDKPVVKKTSTSAAKKTVMYCNTTAGLRFRKSPSTSASLVAGSDSGKSVIGYGDEVTIIKKTGDWYQIKYRNITGYAHGSYLQSKKPNDKYIIINEGRNLRAGASLSSKVLKTTTKNEKAKLLVSTYWYRDGYYWHRVKIGNTTYYLAKV